jgi:energy-coupling factor transporter ATP-binding protein EcfA2
MASVPEDVSEYCNPGKRLKLPFMFAGERPYTRFRFENEYFYYYGRNKFRELYDIAINLDVGGQRLYLLHGSLGVGKSHLLAALACALFKAGRHVVYLPDCRGLLKSPFCYLRSALQLTFANVQECRQYLDNSKTLDDLAQFCYAAAPSRRLFFIIDQANALDPHQSYQMDKNDNEKKQGVRNLLDDISSEHLKLASSSANYQGGLGEKDKQTQEGWMTMYEGLSEVCYKMKNNPNLVNHDGFL